MLYSIVFRKLVFTFVMICIYLLLCKINLPFIDIVYIIEEANSPFYKVFQVFNGLSLTKYSIFSLNILPIIIATIIMQLYFVACRISNYKVKILNRNSIENVVIWIIIIISLVQGYYSLVMKIYSNNNTPYIFVNEYYYLFIASLLMLVFGSLLLYYIIKLINIFGVGKGTSCIALVNVLVYFYNMFTHLSEFVNLYLLPIIILQYGLCITILYYSENSFFLLPTTKIYTYMTTKYNIGIENIIGLFLIFSVGVFGVLPLVITNIFIYYLQRRMSIYILTEMGIGIILIYIISYIVFLFLGKIHRLNYTQQIYTQYLRLNYLKANIDIETDTNTSTNRIVSMSIYKVFRLDVLYMIGLFICSRIAVLFITIIIKLDIPVGIFIDPTNIFSFQVLNNSLISLFIVLVRLLLFFYYKTDMLIINKTNK